MPPNLPFLFRRRTARNWSMAAAAPPPWVILDRVARVQLDDEQHPGEISVSLTAPPRLSTLTVPRSIHPNPGDHDRLPFVVATDADSSVILLLIRQPPFVVTDLSPPDTLFVVHDFVPVHGIVPGDPTATATRLPNRADQPAMPPISNIKHVGVVSRYAWPAVYTVAELKVSFNNSRVRLLYFRSGAASWAEKELPLPVADMPRQILRFHDVLSHDGKLWWVNLRWGVLSCDPFDDQPELCYNALPVTHHYTDPDVEEVRLFTVSEGMLRYVEMSRFEDDSAEAGATTVYMWTLVIFGRIRFWNRLNIGRMEEIWASQSYRDTGMPEEDPVLAAVHHSDPDVLYFYLRRFIFGVNMADRRVVQFVDQGYDLPSRLPPPPPSWRYTLAWERPSSLSQE